MAHNLLEIWDAYTTKVLTEKTLPKETAKFGKKPGKGPVQLNNPKAGDIAHKDTSGPDVTGNFDGPAFNRKIDDLKTMSPKDKADRPYVAALNVFDVEEKFDKDMEKTRSTLINNNMKSTFNQLFEEVMGSEDQADLDALGVTTDAGHGGEEGAEITIKLSPEHVECLKAILAQVEEHGGHEDHMEGETDLGDKTADSDEASDEDEENNAEEDSEEDTEDDKTMKESSGVQYKVTKPEPDGKDVPDNAGLQMISKGKFTVGDETKKQMKAGAKKADYSGFKAKIDADGSEVPDSAGLDLTKTGATSNVPKSKIKAGANAFGIG